MALQRILIAVHHYPPRRVGGAELLTRRLAQSLAQSGVQVRVVCIENLARGPVTRLDYTDELDLAVQVRRIDLTVAEHSDLALWHDSTLLRSHFDEFLASWRPELVHLVSGYLMGTAPLEAAKNQNIPTVVTLTDFWFLCPTIQLLRGDGSLCSGPQEIECARCLYDERRTIRAIDQRAPELVRAFWNTALNNSWLGTPLGLPGRLAQLAAREKNLVCSLNTSDAIVSPTHFLADMHIANGVAAHKIVYKPYCLELNYSTLPEPRSVSTETIRFGFIGQITPIKGVDILLKAFLKAVSFTDKPMELHIYGKANAEPSYLGELERLASESPQIHLHGAYEQRDALKLLNDLDAIVVPSLWYENSPLVILEAFAAKRPVIGTRVGGIAEVVQDDVNGLLFERGNVADLARVLLRVAEDPALLPRLAENIPAPWTVDQDMRDMMAIYRRALEIKK